MVDEPQTGVDREHLEAMRADMIAHVASLSSTRRKTLRRTFDATLKRIDAALARLPARRDGPGEMRDETHE